MTSFAHQVLHIDASAARTATGTGTPFLAIAAKGGFFTVDITAASGTSPTLVVKLQGTVDGTNWFDVDTTNGTTASLTTTGAAAFRVYPGITAAANASSNSILPTNLRFAWTIGGTTPSFTFGTHADLLL